MSEGREGRVKSGLLVQCPGVGDTDCPGSPWWTALGEVGGGALTPADSPLW